MKPSDDDVLKWARESGYTTVDPTINPIELLERFAALAYAAGAADMKERCAKVCEAEAEVWNEPFGHALAKAVRELGDDNGRN